MARVPPTTITQERTHTGDFETPTLAPIDNDADRETVIEPVDRDGVTLYRVLLNSSSDEADALALRDQVAALGYAEARVLRP